MPMSIDDLKKFALDVHNFAYGTEYDDPDIVSAMDFDAIIEKMKTDEKKLVDANKGLSDGYKKDMNRLKRLIVKEKKKSASLEECEEISQDLLSKATDEIDRLETNLKKVPRKSMNYKYMKEMEEQIKESHLKLTDVLTQLDEQKSFAAGHEQQANENHVRYLDEQVKVSEQTEKVKELTKKVKEQKIVIDGHNLQMDFMGCHETTDYRKFNKYLHTSCSKADYEKFYHWFDMFQMDIEFIMD